MSETRYGRDGACSKCGRMVPSGILICGDCAVCAVGEAICQRGTCKHCQDKKQPKEPMRISIDLNDGKGVQDMNVVAECSDIERLLPQIGDIILTVQSVTAKDYGLVKNNYILFRPVRTMTLTEAISWCQENEGKRCEAQFPGLNEMQEIWADHSNHILREQQWLALPRTGWRVKQ